MNNVGEILQLSDSYYQSCQGMIKFARIKKLPDGNYRVLSQSGKNLGTYKSKAGATKRLHQVEFFKHFDKSNAIDSSEVIDLTKSDDFSYSAIMRQVRQQGTKEQVKIFLKIFKKYFDKAIKEKLQKPERIALQNTLVSFNKIHKIKLDKKIVKNAAVSELSDAASVGKYLAGIVKFTLTKISPDKRQKALNNLKHKFYYMNENEIAMKSSPTSAAIGNSIAFVKQILFNHDNRYIREVLNNLVRHL